MTQALFYLMPAADSTTDKALMAIYQLACELAQTAYTQKELVYIHCQDQQQAYLIDELLWQFEPKSFVPHNLKGEGPISGSPVEIGFDSLGSNKKRHIMINLADQAPSFAVNFSQIIDFVASNDKHKIIARERYKQYRALNIALQTQNLAAQPIN